MQYLQQKSPENPRAATLKIKSHCLLPTTDMTFLTQSDQPQISEWITLLHFEPWLLSPHTPPSQTLPWAYLSEMSLWCWTSQIPFKGPCCVLLLAWPNPTNSSPVDSLHSHIESSFPYQAHTGLPRMLFPATRRWEWRAEYSWSLFCFAKPCHGHRLTPKTWWQQPRKKASWNASTRLPEQPPFDIHRGLRGSGLLLFPWASFPSSCPLKHGKYLQLKEASEQLFLN